MAEIIDFKSKMDEKKTDFVPVEEWDGECWKAVWEQFITPNAESSGADPWDVFANFIHNILMIAYDEAGGTEK